MATIVDFDVLNNIHPLKAIVEAHNGEWSAIERNWKPVKEAVESRAAFTNSAEFRVQVEAALNRIDQSPAVDVSILKEIRAVTRKASPWDAVKSVGLNAIPSGEPSRHAEELFEKLKAVGIFVVPVGHIERFCKSEGGHGPRWVARVLQKQLSTDPHLAEAREFVRSVKDYLNQEFGTSLTQPEEVDK